MTCFVRSCILVSLLAFCWLKGACAMASDIPPGEVIVKVATHYALILKADGTLWGPAPMMAERDQKPLYKDKPYILLLTNVTDVVEGSDFNTLDGNGAVWSWSVGRVGSERSYVYPVTTGVTSLVSRNYVRKGDDSLWALPNYICFERWQRKKKQEAGAIKVLDNVRSVVDHNFNYTYAITKDNTLWVWGDDAGSSPMIKKPAVGCTPVVLQKNVQRVFSGLNFVTWVSTTGKIVRLGHDEKSYYMPGDSPAPIETTQKTLAIKTPVRLVDGGEGYIYLTEDHQLWQHSYLYPGFSYNFIEKGMSFPEETPAEQWEKKLGLTFLLAENVKDFVRTFETSVIVKNDNTVWQATNYSYQSRDKYLVQVIIPPTPENPVGYLDKFLEEKCKELAEEQQEVKP